MADVNAVQSGDSFKWYTPAPYTGNPSLVDQIWDAAFKGNWVGVSLLIGHLEIGWLSREMNRLKDEGETFSPLEQGADTLMNLLNAHTKDGVVEASQGMTNFLDKALEISSAAGKAVGDDIQNVINKIKNKQSIGQAEAMRLYGWCADIKRLVIPPEYTNETRASQVKSAKERYDQYVNASVSRARTFSVM